MLAFLPFSVSSTIQNCNSVEPNTAKLFTYEACQNGRSWPSPLSLLAALSSMTSPIAALSVAALMSSVKSLAHPAPSSCPQDMGSYQRVTSTQCDETYILFPRDQSPPAICSGSTYKCFGVPLQNVAVTQSVPNTFLEALGVLDKISVASEYTTSACIAKRVADGAAEAFVSHSSNDTEHADQMGDPALDAIFSDPWYTSSWHHAPSAGKVATYPFPRLPLYPAPAPPRALPSTCPASRSTQQQPCHPPCLGRSATCSGTPHRSSARPPRTSSRRSGPPSGSSSLVRPPPPSPAPPSSPAMIAPQLPPLIHPRRHRPMLRRSRRCRHRPPSHPLQPAPIGLSPPRRRPLPRRRH